MTLSYSLYFFEGLGNSIAIVCSPDCDVIYLEISLMFLNKPLLKMIKRLREKIQISCKEKDHLGEIKIIFHNLQNFKTFKHFKNCIRPESAPLTFSSFDFLPPEHKGQKRLDDES